MKCLLVIIALFACGIAIAQSGVVSPALSPYQLQAVSVVTASDGTFGGTWPTPFATPPSAQIATVPYFDGMTAPVDCHVTADATSFRGKCWQIVSMTIPATTTAALGAVMSPVANAASGLTIKVIGRQ